MKKYLYVSSILFLCLSCYEDDSSPNQEEVTISATAESYLNEVLDIMETNSLNRNTIDWEDFRNEVFDVAGTAQSVDDVYESGALLRALELLGDNHSFIRRDNGEFFRVSKLGGCPISDISYPEAGSIPSNIGYIFIPAFNSIDDKERVTYAEYLQGIVQEKDSPENIGWIVDLRINTGGSMYPMLAGIGPLLGEGIAGYFIGPNGEEISWGYSQGKAMIGQRTLTEIENPYILSDENPKVAVLLDLATASSGEAIAISFINRDDSATFGSPTCGLSTANSSFPLSDNSTLFLTTATMADRQKNIFGGKIQPDFSVSNEEIIARAVEFIQND